MWYIFIFKTILTTSIFESMYKFLSIGSFCCSKFSWIKMQESQVKCGSFQNQYGFSELSFFCLLFLSNTGYISFVESIKHFILFNKNITTWFKYIHVNAINALRISNQQLDSVRQRRIRNVLKVYTNNKPLYSFNRLIRGRPLYLHVKAAAPQIHSWFFLFWFSPSL